MCIYVCIYVHTYCVCVHHPHSVFQICTSFHELARWIGALYVKLHNTAWLDGENQFALKSNLLRNVNTSCTQENILLLHQNKNLLHVHGFIQKTEPRAPPQWDDATRSPTHCPL